MVLENMNIITIKVPIWKSRSVGISEDKLSGEFIGVKISYKDKTGNFLYPSTYFMRCSKVMLYPRDKKLPKLHIVPISDFMIKEQNKD
jgi:hypothetical protein